MSYTLECPSEKKKKWLNYLKTACSSSRWVLAACLSAYIWVCDVPRSTHTFHVGWKIHNWKRQFWRHFYWQCCYCFCCFSYRCSKITPRNWLVDIDLRVFAHNLVKCNCFQWRRICKLRSTMTCFSWPHSHKNEAPSYIYGFALLINSGSTKKIQLYPTGSIPHRNPMPMRVRKTSCKSWPNHFFCVPLLLYYYDRCGQTTINRFLVMSYEFYWK